MSMGSRYSPLDGTVTLNADMPVNWADRVADFYHKPNNEQWDGAMSRVLFHESVHHWQMLSSGYIASLVQEEWAALLRFEAGGPAETPGAVASLAEASGQPFSAKELMECWARYWDVHTRSPTVLLSEERLDPVYQGPRPNHGIPVPPYTGAEFDAFLQYGQDAVLYGRPYRWALHQVSHDSHFLNAVFPTLVFNAYGSPGPVEVFTSSLRNARESEEVARAVADSSKVINVAWMRVYKIVREFACKPALMALKMPLFTWGVEVMERGRAMRTHPIYSLYRHKVRELPLRLADLPRLDPLSSTIGLAHELCRAGALEDPGVVFMFPGQPTYRQLLGFAVPPPRIVFRDGEWCADGEPAVLSGGEDRTIASAYTGFDRRVTAFRNACYAARHGLDVNQFRPTG